MDLSDILVATTGFGAFMLSVGAIIVIFQVVLFFKIWTMTEDVTQIRKLFEKVVEAEYEEVKTLKRKSNFWSLTKARPTEVDNNSKTDEEM